MRSITLSLAVLVTAALAVSPMNASAATFGGEVFGAWNTYSMSDWNDAIDESNTSGADYNNLSSGLTGGVGLRMWANENWLVSACWEPLFAKTEDSSTPGTSLSFNANSYQLSTAYFFPSSSPQRYGIGGGLGYYSLNGKGEAPASPAIDVTGSTVGFHFMGLADWRVNPSFSVNATAGYRIANVDETKVDGTVVTDANGDNMTTDYSGLMSRVGFSFYMPTSR